ncbi:MAG: ABC transporter ATP-binding protein/permease [Spirochaetaceae bacterium]|nr:ABC transporter ATP-binding protein/permease [Spirochaetaceae bacterium]
MALLVVQAFCDLALPNITSSIVDVGIMNGGIEGDAATVAAVKAAHTKEELAQIQISYMWRQGLKMLLIALLGLGVAIVVGFLASRTAAKIGRDLRRKTYLKTLSFSGKELDYFTTASLITRNTNDIQQIQFVIVLILRMVLFSPVMGIGGIVMVAGKKTGLAWIIVIAVALISVLVVTMFSLTMPKFRLLQKMVDKVNQVSREILTGLSVIRAFSREQFEEKRFDDANTDLMRTQRFTNRVMSFMNPGMMLLMNGIMCMIIWFAAKRIDLGDLLVGDLIAFMTYAMMIVMSFMMISMISIMLPRANVAVGRIEEVCNTEPIIQDPVGALRATPLQGVKPDGTPAWQGIVQYNDVSFHYPALKETGTETETDMPADAIEHISFTAQPGEITAIIGSTGSGKSSLVNLLPRFYDATGGSVSIDGIDVRNMTLHELHRIMGFVPQKAVLFSGTIGSNIMFGQEEGEMQENPPPNLPPEGGGARASKDGAAVGAEYIPPSDGTQRMKEAAEIAQATEFIEEKPETYDSPIAEGGSNVSGGQKQRLAIARAIAKRPKILVFDDSFSALDYKTDAALRNALREKCKSATVIIVAQRISTVLHADNIIVLDEGKMMGQGTHSELMQSCETYREIARSQLSEEELSRETVGAEYIPPVNVRLRQCPKEAGNE